MPTAKAPVTDNAKAGGRFLVMLIVLVAVLAVLFRSSFQPDQVLFSNDGPLGAGRAQEDTAIKNLFGQWQTLNWVGGPALGLFLRPSDALYIALGSVWMAKFHVPLALLALGLCAWFFFRQLGFDWRVCLLGGLAAALNTNALSNSCWGLSVWMVSRACFYLALAALPNAAARNAWPGTALAGIVVGLGVMEGFDVGAVLSVYVGAYVLFQSLLPEGKAAGKIAVGAGRLAVVAVCAGLAAAQAIVGLVGTQVSGVVGMEQDAETRQKRWEGATQWSLPRAEALKVIVPGLFGHRMPQLYGESEESAEGSNYWGGVGRGGGFRHSGNGEFAGVLVILLAAWGVAQSFRRKGAVFSDVERRCIWFWGGAAVISLLLAFGKHAPFYALAYQIPYFSTIRNPIKFMHPFHFSVVILFAYGLQGLFRRYSTSAPAIAGSMIAQVKAWFKKAAPFDRKWTVGCLLAIVASLLAWLTYASSRTELIERLQRTGFPEESLAASIATFSVWEAGKFIVIFSIAIALVILFLSGAFSGRRGGWAWPALGLLLVTDLMRADAHWIVYWNYREKYASNPIIDLLRETPFERRVTAELLPLSRQYLVAPDEPGTNFATLYGYEWLQHLFQYYRVQSLDVIQMPRVAQLDEAFFMAFRPSSQTNLSTCARLWQLTNTRFILGSAAFLEFLNNQLDPGRNRFRIHTRFNVTTKPGITRPTKPEHLTAVPALDGPLALFEFEGALPRAKLYGNWQVQTNDTAALEQLKSPDFDGSQSVLVAEELPRVSPTAATNPPPGTVEIVHYEPKQVRLEAVADTAAVLLLNDRFDGDWKVSVDGTPAKMLRCNLLMRGVFLEPGRHEIEFRYEPPRTAFYITLTTLLAGACLLVTVGRLRD